MLIEIPDSIFRQPKENLDKVKLEIAIALFQEEMFTLGQASKFLGVLQFNKYAFDSNYGNYPYCFSNSGLYLCFKTGEK